MVGSVFPAETPRVVDPRPEESRADFVFGSGFLFGLDTPIQLLHSGPGYAVVRGAPDNGRPLPDAGSRCICMARRFIRLAGTLALQMR